MTAPAQRGIVGCEETVKCRGVDVADGVGAGPHGGIKGRRATDAARDRVLADTAGAVGWQAGRAFPTASARPGGCGALLV